MLVARLGLVACGAALLVGGCGATGDSVAAATSKATATPVAAATHALAADTPTPEVATPPAGEILSAADRASFAKLGATLDGSEGVAVAFVGLKQPVFRAGGLATGVAWSSSKPAVAMAAIAAGTASSADLTKAITASDNAAAERLWAGLGTPSAAAAATTKQVRAAGDSTTVIQSKRLRGSAYTAFGQTNWSLANEAHFVGGMGCSAAGEQVLALMHKVIPSQRWGLGTIGPNAALKGGWGPGIKPGVASGWMERQMGIVEIGGHALAVAIATTAGDHATGTKNLTKVASWLKSHASAAGAPAAPNCD